MFGIPAEVQDYEGSRHSLDSSDGIYRIHSDGPGAADFQQAFDFGSIPRSFNRILACYHVHSPRAAATKTCLGYIFRSSHLSELGPVPREPRLTHETKAVVQSVRPGRRLWSGRGVV